MILVLYNLLLLLALGAATPYWLFRVLTEGKYREGFWERLGRVPAGLRAAGQGKRTIWVHAVSVGEVTAVSRLVEQLDAVAPEYRVVISTTTRTGQQLARARFGHGRCFYYPLDLPWAVRQSLRVLRPAILVLAESEFWPNMLAACRRAHVPVAVVNGRVSDRSLPRYLRLRRVWRPFLEVLTLLQAQSETDARRFIQIGVPAARVQVGGNLKFDVRPPAAAAIVDALRRNLPAGAPVLVCGSTLEGEEAILLDAWSGVLQQTPNAVTVVAPRHPERFAAVGELVARRGLSLTRRSQWMEQPGPLAPGSVFLLDSIGELAAVYGLGAVAFVGGSLVPAGGHNPLEPAQCGVAVVMGEHYENFRGSVELLRAHNAITLTSPEALEGTLRSLFSEPDRAVALGVRAKTVVERESGATGRAVKAIVELLQAKGRA